MIRENYEILVLMFKYRVISEDSYIYLVMFLVIVLELSSCGRDFMV